MMKTYLLGLLFVCGVFSQCLTSETRVFSQSYSSVSQIFVKNPLGSVSFCSYSGTLVEVSVSHSSGVTPTIGFGTTIISIDIASPEEQLSSTSKSLPGILLSLFCTISASISLGKRKFGLFILFASLVPIIFAVDTGCADVIVRVPSGVTVSSYSVEDIKGQWTNAPTLSPCTSLPATSNAQTATSPSTNPVPTSDPTTSVPTTGVPTTGVPTTAVPTTAVPTTAVPTTAVPTTAVPTTAVPTTAVPTTAVPTTARPTTAVPTTAIPTTAQATTRVPTTAQATTRAPTTAASTTGSTTTGGGVIKPIAFRLDDIQDYWITPAQKAIINMFKTKNLPMSIGIIANSFGDDTDILNFIKGVIGKTPYIDVMDHGYNHEDFSTFTLAEQNNLLAWAKQNISHYLGITTDTFMPPYNTINTNTITALTNNGFTLLSSEVSQDPPPWNFNNPTLWRFPIGAQTADLVGNNYKGVPYTKTLGQIVAQYNSYGFAAVMMHPQEFSNFQGGQYVNVVNNTQLAELNTLLDTLVSQGYTFCALNQLKNYAYLYHS